LANELKNINSTIKIIFTSGYTDNYIVKSGNLEKDINFIQKPFTEQSLALKIRTVLDNPN